MAWLCSCPSLWTGLGLWKPFKDLGTARAVTTGPKDGTFSAPHSSDGVEDLRIFRDPVELFGRGSLKTTTSDGKNKKSFDQVRQLQKR